MKRKMAFLLAVALTVSGGFMAFAMEPNTPGQTQEASPQPSGTAQDVQEPEEEGGKQSSGEEPSGTDISETDTGSDTVSPGDASQTQTNVPDSDNENQQPGPGTGEPITEPGAENSGTGNTGTGSGNTGAGTGNTGTGSGNTGTGTGNTGMGTGDIGTGSGNTGTIPGAGNSGAEPGVQVSGPLGRVDVSIGADSFLKRSVDFNVKLENASDKSKSWSGTVTVSGEGTNTGVQSFPALSDGEYILTVSADGFATYTQPVEVKGMCCTVKLMTGFAEGFEYRENVFHPGVLVVGDVAGNDGRVDETDKNALVNAIDRGEYSASMDLNGDGAVDLADLEYFARTYNDARHLQAGVEKSVPGEAIVLTEGENTAVEGNLQALLRGESVKLRPADGAEISESNPVVLQFDFAEAKESVMTDGVIIETGAANPITSAVISIVYMDENGNEQTFVDYPVAVGEDGEAVHPLLTNESVHAERDENGNIRLHLGTQIAVKRVTLKIMGTKNDRTLAEISRVEFVNGMEERIPEPEMDIPEGLAAVAGDKRISLSWEPCRNVTGYEVMITGPGGKQATMYVTGNSLQLTSLGNGKIVNYETYQICVQSVNGTWRSGYCGTVEATPIPTGKPDKPDNLTVAGKYCSIAASWKKMEDTLSYNLYYKEAGQAGDYQKIEGIQENSYTLTGLKELTEYEIRVSGVNELGEGPMSLPGTATTTDLSPAAMPKYKLINTGSEGEKGAHITGAAMLVSNVTSMENSLLDTQAGTAWGTVDHDQASYYLRKDWDDGYTYEVGQGLTYEFDDTYKIDTIAFYTFDSQDEGLAYAKVRIRDENGNEVDRNAVLQKKTDGQNKVYYVAKLSQPVNTQKLQLRIGRSNAYARRISIAELYFYYYDSLHDDIMALYEDDLHTVLRQDVTQETIDALRERLNTPDEVSGELHPDRAKLELELKTAEDILKEQDSLSAPIIVHNSIIRNDVSRGFGGLNAWQPLGVTAAAQEDIIIYVGHSTKSSGDNTSLQLVATQFNAEASAMSSVVANLKVGRNEVTIPKIWSLAYESGGALYVQCAKGETGQYSIRVNGGVQVPVLDLYQVEGDAERLAKTTAYVEKLGEYVSKMEETHKSAHQGEFSSELVKKDYDRGTCILEAADILSDTMMLSLPAAAIWEGSGKNGTSVEARARTILNSVDAMEEMMYLFYQHKGLNSSAANEIDRLPAGHQNIRCQRMFSGAFMYAAGNHIGIGWGSTAGMVTGVPVTADANGKWQSGSYFGWGIAHEIGHCINQNTYSVAEITNNYFSVLAQARDTNDSVRFKYDEVYKKVTSGAKGQASNVFTQLGMYWQLHLAYDDGYNYRTYPDHKEQLANLFFARVDSYSRNTANAPKPGGIALSLSGDKDQNLMRLACAAAEKNILEFFERWGMTPDAGTRSYAEQFASETRAIYYVNDDARVYRIESGKGSSLDVKERIHAVGNEVAAKLVGDNRVEINLNYEHIAEADVLGYEIVRCTVSKGEIVRQPVGFVAGSSGSFTDTIATMNNRTVFYEVTLIDQYLYRSAVKTLSPVKIQHEGDLEKAFWTVSISGMTVAEPEPGEGDDDSPCAPDLASESDKLIDNDLNSVFTAEINGSPEITLNFNKTLTVAGFKITTQEKLSGSYTIQVCSGGIWLDDVAGGELNTAGEQTIYFANSDNKYVSTYDASAVRLVLKNLSGKELRICELDVLGPTGDNIDFGIPMGDGSTVTMGRLTKAYEYGTEAEDVIPEGSIIFTGSYKGNSAYNVVVLYDQDGNVIGTDSGDGREAKQIILADVPDSGEIQDVRDGIWIYWMEPENGEQLELQGVTKVRAELYRVNDATTNEGERLVSDSMFVDVPEILPEVTLSGMAGF